jgi:hypothetical protein
MPQDTHTQLSVIAELDWSGTVNSWHARQIAAETAWGAPGTVDVENLLAVI